MSDDSNFPYGTWKDEYRARGFYPRALINVPDAKTGEKRGKACLLKGWQTSDPDLPAGTLEKWDRNSFDWNIGLLMGSPFPDGSQLCALDIDNDFYVRMATT